MRWVHLCVVGAISALYGLAGVTNATFAPAHRYWDIATIWDQLAPFNVAFAWPYLSYYLLLGIPLVLPLPYDELRSLWRRLAYASVVSAVLFLLIPTSPPRFLLIDELQGVSAWIVQMIYLIDPPSNCFPSLHVLHSGLIALFYVRRPQTRGFGILFCLMALGVCLATVYIKQHYVVDVIAALVLIPIVELLSFRDLRGRKIKPTALSHSL